MFGGFLKLTNRIRLESVENAIKKNLSPKLYELNVKALQLGFENINTIK